MGKTKPKYVISITDTNTNTTISEELLSPVVTYNSVVDLIESYYP